MQWSISCLFLQCKKKEIEPPLHVECLKNFANMIHVASSLFLGKTTIPFNFIFVSLLSREYSLNNTIVPIDFLVLESLLEYK